MHLAGAEGKGAHDSAGEHADAEQDGRLHRTGRPAYYVCAHVRADQGQRGGHHEEERLGMGFEKRLPAAKHA